MRITKRIKLTVCVVLFLLAFSADQVKAQWVTNQAYSDSVSDVSVLTQGVVHGTDDRIFASVLNTSLRTELWYSDDDGTSWSKADMVNDEAFFYAFANAGNDVIYSYAPDFSLNKIFLKSVDGGASWDLVPTTIDTVGSFFSINDMAAIDSVIIMNGAGTNANMIKSTNGGLNWIGFRDIPGVGESVGLESLRSSGNYFVVNGVLERAFRSHKDSTSWVEMDIGGGFDTSLHSIFDMEVTANGRILIVTDLGLHYSDNQGETFTLIESNDLNIPEDGNLLFIIPLENEFMLIYQTNNGQQTIYYNQDLTSLDVTGDLNEQDSSLFSIAAGSNNTVIAKRSDDIEVIYLFNKSQITSSLDEEIEAVDDFTLSQNFPNPFNPSTNISFELNQTGFASLKVYDMLGREVATLLNGRVSAGAQTVVFDAQNLSSGVYYYRLVSGGQSLTRAMTLIK